MIGRFRAQETIEPSEPKGFDDFDLRLGDVMRGERATLGKSLLDVQRELKIKATYIAAIENADPTAFETPGFIAGYVRSYSRYLGLDAGWAWKAFCAEGEFETAHGMSAAASSRRSEAPRPLSRGESMATDHLADSRLRFAPQGGGMMARLEPGAIGSTLVLAALVGLLGYGGFAVLTEVQRVHFVPVEQAPEVVADLDPLTSMRAPTADGDSAPDVVAAMDGFDRLYRPEALDVPVLVPRDGPIASLDPRRMGALAAPDAAALPAALAASVGADGDPRGYAPLAGDLSVDPAVLAAAGTDGADGPAGVRVTAEGPPQMAVVATGETWVRIRSADGTTLYEKVMQEGDRFVLPSTEEPATLRTGQSGAVFFAINGEPFGPVGARGQVTGNLVLTAAALAEAYGPADPAANGALEQVIAELRDAAPQVPGPAGGSTDRP